MKKHTTTAITAISFLLGAAIAGIAFTLSFDALREIAIAAGISQSRAWLFPLSIDGFVLTAGAAVLLESLRGKRAWYPIFLVGGFTAISIALNNTHAAGLYVIPEQTLRSIVALIPPSAFFLALELLTGQIKTSLAQSDDPTAQLSAKLARVETVAAQLRGEITEANAKSAQLQTELDDLHVIAPLLDAMPKSARAKLAVAGANGAADKMTARELAQIAGVLNRLYGR